MLAAPELDDVTLAASGAVPVLISANHIDDVRALARRIHDAGRSDSPLIEVEAALLPARAPDFAAAWLTLANTAAGGSILVSEVETLHPGAQRTFADLMTYSRARGVRLITGTTSRLHELVEKGEFSAALFYRLNVVHLTVAILA
jgi:DNA-binding NtrC family response regulator